MAIFLQRLFMILLFVPLSASSFIKSSPLDKVQVKTTPGLYEPFPDAMKAGGFFQEDSDECIPENNYAAIDERNGFNGLGIEYAIEGMPVSEFQESPRVLSGYPTGSQVIINFTFHGPYSIVDNHSTSAWITVNGKTFDEIRAPNQNGEPGWSYTAQPVVVDITDEIRQNGFEVVANVGYRRSSNTEGFDVTVRGIKCDKPISAQPSLGLPIVTPPLDEGDFPWVILVGAVVGTAALGAAAITVIRLATQSRRRPPEANETAGFILQLNDTEFSLIEGVPVKLRATAWRVLGNGAPQLASDALITIQPPSPASGVTILPLTGQGDAFFTILLKDGGSKLPVTFQVSAAAAESSSKPQEVTLKKGSKFVARVNGKKRFDVLYHPLEKTWSLPDIVCYFCGNDEVPEKTSFEWGVPQSPVQFSPDKYIEKAEIYVHDPATNAFTIKLRLVKDLNFNPNTQAATWLEQDGMVEATVTVQDDRGQTHSDTVQLRFRPQLRLMFFSYDGSLDKAGSHVYLENTWNGMQFLADGIDKLNIALFYVRTDKAIPKEDKVYLHADRNVQIESLTWKTGSFLSPPEADALNSKDGVFGYTISSNDCVKPSPELTRQKYQLIVSPRLNANAPKNYTFEKAEELVVVEPQFILPRFYVIPGQYPHTSLAVAYVKTVPSNKPLVNLPLRLSVLNPGSAWLSLDGCDALQKTVEKEDPRFNQRFQRPIGTASWTLRYSGLSWDKLSNTRFQVVCEGPQGKLGPSISISHTIDVNKNVRNLLNELFYDPQLYKSLNNLSLTNVSKVLPSFCLGPVWNMYQLFDTNKPFVCWNMRDKIIEWMKNRRHYSAKRTDVEAQLQSMTGMNGIEFEIYEMLPAHVYAGIFLSGCKQNDCRVIDPWWEQRWDDPAMLQPENLHTLNWEAWNATKLAAVIGVMAIALKEMYLGIGVKLGYGPVIALVKSFVKGTSIPVALAKLGLKSHVFSTYAYDYTTVLLQGAYYDDSGWFIIAVKTLKEEDGQKYGSSSSS